MKHDCKLPNAMGTIEHTCLEHKDREWKETSGARILCLGCQLDANLALPVSELHHYLQVMLACSSRAGLVGNKWNHREPFVYKGTEVSESAAYQPVWKCPWGSTCIFNIYTPKYFSLTFYSNSWKLVLGP